MPYSNEYSHFPFNAEVVKSLGDVMRISDRVLKCVVFLGIMKHKRFVPVSTAFLVHKQYKEGIFQYLVTCQHSIEQKELFIRANLKVGGAAVDDDPIKHESWVYHPEAEKRFIDVAVVPVNIPFDIYDVVSIPLDFFCTREFATERDIGVGEELFYPGLFVHHHGQGRNLPVMRTATLAGMPIEQVQTQSGAIWAYLVEGRSIGGHSGSPVFANLLAPRAYYADKLVQLPHPSKDTTRYPLLGMIRSYFKASDTGEYTEPVSPEEDLWVNSGISTAVPAWEIEETINQEELEKRRQLEIEKHRKNSADVPASFTPTVKNDSENPSHKEDFTRLVSGAAKKQKQDH